MIEHPSKARAFAAAIARRYGEEPLIAPLLDLVVRLNPQESRCRISPFVTHVQIAPRIGITLMNDPQPSAGRVALPDGSGLRSEVVQRLTDRHRRLDAAVTGEAADPGPARAPVMVSAAGHRVPAADEGRRSGASPAPPLPMTVCRPTRAAAVDTGGNESHQHGARPAQTSERLASTHTRARESARGDPSAKVNVEQLTDNVIRAIDRRIVAYRERTAQG